MVVVVWWWSGGGRLSGGVRFKVALARDQDGALGALGVDCGLADGKDHVGRQFATGCLLGIGGARFATGAGAEDAAGGFGRAQDARADHLSFSLVDHGSD
jgi:hypothetical protein